MVQKAAYTEGLVFAVQSIGLFKQVPNRSKWYSRKQQLVLQQQTQYNWNSLESSIVQTLRLETTKYVSKN